MSYNGIGLRTVRGSGTNGYIQKNRSSISHLHRNDNPADLKPPVAKAPNKEIIEHEKKRQIELKVLMYEEKLKERKASKEDIKKACKILREQLQEQFARDPSAMKSNLSETHQKQAAKQKEDARLRIAFDIDGVEAKKRNQNKPAYVEGAAFEQIGNPGYMAKDNFERAAALERAKAKAREKEKKDMEDPKLPESFLDRTETEKEFQDRIREERARRDAKRNGFRRDREEKPHWRPPRSHSRSRSRGRRSLSRSRSRSRSRGRGKGLKRSRTPEERKKSDIDNKKKQQKRSITPPKKKKVAEPTALSSLLLPQGGKKAKKQKGKKKASKKSSSDSSSSSDSDSSSSSSSSSNSDSSSDSD